MATDIVVNVDGLHIGDLETLALFDGSDESTRQSVIFAHIREILDMLDRVVEGGARSLPLSLLPKVMEAVSEGIKRSSNPEVGKGN